MDEQKSSGNGVLIYSLALARYATQPHSILLGLLMIDIGLSYNYPIGIIGQLRTVSSMVAVVFAVIAGALSMRFSAKNLILFGLLSLMVSALGCCFAPSFSLLLILFSLSGIGFALIGSMSSTLIGEYVPQGGRAKAMGILISSLALSYLISSQAIRHLSEIGGWRLGFSWYIFPVSLLGFLIAFWGIPKGPERKAPSGVNLKIYEGYKAVLTNRSALACLIGYTAYMIAWSVLLLFNSSYLRQVFGVSISFAAIITVLNSLGYIFGSLISNRIVKKMGSKLTSAIFSAIVGITIVIYFGLSSLSSVVSLAFFCCVASGIIATSGQTLALEQVSSFRGTMMSINSATISLGSALSGAFGGYILLTYSYKTLGYLMGLVSLLSFVMYYKFASNPISN